MKVKNDLERHRTLVSVEFASDDLAHVNLRDIENIFDPNRGIPDRLGFVMMMADDIARAQRNI